MLIAIAMNARRSITLAPRLVSRLLCLGAIGSNLSMWVAAVYTMSASSHAQGAQSSGSMVPQENIQVSLPVFIVSIGATAAFTWAVAQHDRKSDRRIDEATNEIEERLNGKIEDLEATLNKLLRRVGSNDITDT